MNDVFGINENLSIRKYSNLLSYKFKNSSGSLLYIYSCQNHIQVEPSK